MFVSRFDLLRYLTNIIASKDERVIATSVLQTVSSFFHTEHGSIYLYNCNEQLLPVAFYPEKDIMQLDDLWKACLVDLEQVVLYQRNLPIANQEWQKLTDQLGYETIVFMPLMNQKEVIGFMLLTWKEPHYFREDDDKFLNTLGNLLGLGLFNIDLMKGLQNREEELQTMCRALIKIKEDEAKRISRELHDEVGQDLTTIILRMKIILSQKDIEEIYDDVKDLLYITRESLINIQRIAMDLRPSSLDNLGLLPSINWQLDQFRKDNKLEIIFNHPAKLDKLTEEKETVLYRVLLELVTNVVRHAHATKVVIDMGLNGQELYLKVIDNGIGMDLDGATTKGLGLMGVKERIDEQNGSFSLESELGKGTSVLVGIPI